MRSEGGGYLPSQQTLYMTNTAEALMCGSEVDDLSQLVLAVCRWVWLNNTSLVLHMVMEFLGKEYTCIISKIVVVLDS